MAALFGRLDEVVYRGRDLTIEFKSTVVDDRGRRSAESVWGADFGFVAKLQTRDDSFAKAALGQAKRGDLGDLIGDERERFRVQVVKMNQATTATLALEVPTRIGEIPQVRAVFSIAAFAAPGGSDTTRLLSDDLILPRDSRERRVVLGARWSLDEYICRELIFCRHGDRSESLLRALEQSTLATLNIVMSGRVSQQANAADESR